MRVWVRVRHEVQVRHDVRVNHEVRVRHVVWVQVNPGRTVGMKEDDRA